MAMTRWTPFGTLERWDPFRNLGDIQHEVNRLFDNFSGRPAQMATTPGERMWLPAVDVRETKDEVVLSFDVPGMTDKDIQLSITGDLLTVKGERRFERGENQDTYHRVERVYGKFERMVQLATPVQTDKVKATYREGVLEVRLPKVEEVKPHDIKIDLM